MSSYTPKDNSGSLFVNDRKERESHADRKGTARINGVDYWVNGWIKKKEDGTTWMSMSFQRKEAPISKEATTISDDEILF